jgi:hypothetical protein
VVDPERIALRLDRQCGVAVASTGDGTDQRGGNARKKEG